jgi:GNAT superfamily N-acetyltransferase
MSREQHLPSTLTLTHVVYVCLVQGSGAVLELEPQCVLDFYVHESCQRTGIGKALFEVGALAVNGSLLLDQ